MERRVDPGAPWRQGAWQHGPWRHGPWQHGPWRHGSRRRRVVGLAVGMALLQVFGSRAAAADQPGSHLDILAYVLLLAGPAALLCRRRAPVPVLAAALAATVAYALSGYPRGPFFVAAVVATFVAVGAGRRTPAWALVWLAYAAYLAGGWLLDVPEPARPGLRDALVVGVWALIALVLAEANRVRLQYVGEVARHRAEQARTRAEQERRQVSEERLRIARELHDVLGHHLSLINVQAGVGLHLMDGRPEQAREALVAIKAASAEALREVRSVLGVLNPQDEAAPRAPAPGLDRLAELTAAAGLPVRVEVAGTARPLPAEVDRAAYRIVQEALTNVRRHAGPGASAVVLIGYGDSELTVRVDDDGTAAPPAVDRPGDARPGDGAGDHAADRSGGSGIAGMRARSTALGGRLRAGPRPGGGFRVEAHLPLGAGLEGGGDMTGTAAPGGAP